MESTKKTGGLEVLGMKINNITEALTVADYFANSDLVPNDYKGKKGNIIVAWQKGFEVGFLPQQSLETIAVINGRACIWGDGLIALIKNSPKEEWTNERIEGTGDDMIAYCETKRKGQDELIKASFSVNDAKVAGLWNNNTWKKYPKRMLQMRARGFCFRDAYPDVLNGLQLAEEISDLENSSYVSDINEIELTINQLGLTLSKNNGKATINGGTYGKENTLKELGFIFENNMWNIYYKDDTQLNNNVVDAELVPEDQNKQPKTQSPAMQLFSFLSKEEIKLNSKQKKTFVNDFLGLTKDDTEEISKELSDLDELTKKVNNFIQIEGINDDTNSLFDEPNN